MIRAFAYLAGRSAVNRLRLQARALRNPRYLAALLLGGGYLGYVVLAQTAPSGPLPHPRLVELLGALLLLGVTAWVWSFTPERRALAFTAAEATLLFPAPLTRRQLVMYKLLRSQTVVLLNALVWTVLLARGPRGVPAWMYALALWLLLSAISLHRLGASFVRTSIAEHGRHGARRRWPAVAVLGIAAAALAAAVAQALPDMSAAWAQGPGPFARSIVRMTEGNFAAVVLAPFRIMVRPLVAGTAAEWLVAVWPAALVVAAHVVWVIRSDAAFEEAALEDSLTRARRLEARKGQRAAAPATAGTPIVPLRPSGPPAGAILWKNLVAVTRGRRIGRWAAAWALGGAILAGLSLRGIAVAELAGALLLTWSGFAVGLGPLWMRNDLRTDLARLDILRMLPLSGAAIVTAEIAAATVALCAVQYALAIATYLALVGSTSLEVPLADRTALLLLALVALPWLNFTGLAVQNAAALLFPAWVRVGAGRPGGVEALGQNLLLLAAFWIVMAGILAPAIGVGGLAWRAARPLGPAGAAILGGGAGLLVILLELRAGLAWLGRVFERTEPGAALPAA